MSDENKITDPRKVNMLGVDVNIADILGDKLVNQFIAQMTPEQTKDYLIMSLKIYLQYENSLTTTSIGLKR